MGGQQQLQIQRDGTLCPTYKRIVEVTTPACQSLPDRSTQQTPTPSGTSGIWSRMPTCHPETENQPSPAAMMAKLCPQTYCADRVSERKKRCGGIQRLCCSCQLQHCHSCQGLCKGILPAVPDQAEEHTKRLMYVRHVRDFCRAHLLGGLLC
jgi:hypothetical protein